MLEVAEIVGRTLNEVYVDVDQRMTHSDVSASASMLLGGQRLGGQLRLFLIYREGNFIEATDDTPYLQIGEHKYGKPILDRVVRPSTPLEDGRKAVLISMDSTLRSNLSVGMPLDLLTIRRNEYRVATRERIEAGDPTFAAMSEAWSKALRDGFPNLRDEPGPGSLDVLGEAVTERQSSGVTSTRLMETSSRRSPTRRGGRRRRRGRRRASSRGSGRGSGSPG